MKKNTCILLCTIALMIMPGFTRMLTAQTWTSVDGGGSNGINSTGSSTSTDPSVTVYNGSLYAIWQETVSGVPQIHIKKYNGSTWDNAGSSGSQLNENTTGVDFPKIASCNGKLYAAWKGYEDIGWGQVQNNVHIKEYNGTSWSYAEHYATGDGRKNINYQVNAHGKDVDLLSFNNELYATWLEDANITGTLQVRVSKFNGSLWTSIDGNGTYGLNYNAGYYAVLPRLGVYNNKVYVTWTEYNGTFTQIRIKRFDGGSTWTFVDGNGANGLNYDTGKASNSPIIVSDNNYLYLFWNEITPTNADKNTVRVKKYNGTTWTTTPDGGSWLYTAGKANENPSACAYNGLFYVSWEDNLNPRQIRVVSFDGTTKTFIDGNGTYGINQNTGMRALYPKLIISGGDLYDVWFESTVASANTPTQIRAKKYSLPAITTSVTVPANATYKISDALNFTVNFNKNVNVAGGTPYIPITLTTGGTVNATYTSGSGTTALTFRYTIAAGNADPDGITVGSSIVLPGGCTLRDANSVDANLTLNSVGSTTGVLVDGIAPVVSSINWQTPATSPTNATSLVYRVTFSRSVSNVDISDFTLTKTATATGTIASVTSSSGTTIDVTVNAVSGYGTLRLDLNSSGTGIIDTPGNAISGGFTSGQAYSIYGASTATTNAASSITATGATLNGTINANNASTTVTFDYGLTIGYGSSATATPSPVTGTSNTSVSASLSGLTPNTTYYYRVKGVNTGGTTYGLGGSFTTTAATNSTFQTAGNWSLASNWSAGIPGSATEATISANCTVDGNFTTGNLIISATSGLTILAGNTLTATGDLNLESDNNGTGSLINSGTLTVSGNTTARRYMTANKWHIVSPTVAGGSISTFIQAGGNSIPVKNVSDYGMMDYDETGNGWKTYFTTGTVGNLTAGKGYSIRRSADGVVTFSGTLTSGTKTVALTKVGAEGWNCVGNPYPSAINMNTTAHATDNFIYQNSGILDASYACVYVWDEGTFTGTENFYSIISNSGFTLPGKTNLSQNYVAPGQGFFVKARNPSTNITFTAAMQTHQATTALKSAKVSWPGFQLTTTTAEAKASTIITFNNAMTKGLDVSYDAGLLRGTSGLELYSRLVDDNGVDFAIQCLPENYNSLVIPVGLESKTGGEITFSAETVELPVVCNVILEDKLAKTFTSLANGATYKATVSAGTTAVGRFYIHTNSSTTGTSKLSSGAFSLKAYPANGQIWIIGEVAHGAKASLFDVNGRNLGTYNLQEGSRNSISIVGLAPGVYLLNVTEASKRFNTKVVIY